MTLVTRGFWRAASKATPVNVREAGEIERSVAAFARSPNGGLIMTQTANFYRDLIIALAARHKLPAVNTLRYDATGGGLLSYRPDVVAHARPSNTIRPHASIGYKPPAPEVFVPAFAAWPAALRRSAPPATLAQRPTLN